MGNPISKIKKLGGWNMNQKIALFLALSLVSVGLVTLLPTAAAQPYGGSVVTGDGSDPPNLKNYFDLWDNVYYYVTATDNGTPLQYKSIDIEIANPSGTIVHWNSITTDEFGEAEGLWWGTSIPDKYTLFANYTSNPIANTTFRVYDPIPISASVVTYANDYRDSGGIPAIYFNTDDWVYFSIYVEDQYGNPFRNDGQVFTYIEHNGDSNLEWWWDEYTDSEAYIDEYYFPGGDFDDEERFGTYLINISNENDDSIGNATFIVVDVDISITPDKAQYVQGDGITILVETSIDDTIDIRIQDPEGDDLSGANWTGQPVSNGRWTKEYTLGTNLPDGDYQVQVLKDGNLMETRTITLRKYNLKVWTDTGAYLPGETMKVYYTITSNKDGSGINDAALQWVFEYYDEDDSEWDVKRDTISTPGSQGFFQVSIPKSAYKPFDGDLWVWANDTHDHSSFQYRSIEIGGIDASVDTDNNEYLAGDFVVVDIWAHVNGADLRNGNVAFTVSKDDVEIPAYTANNLKTDIQGDLVYVFVLQSGAQEGFYTIEINVTKAGTNEYDVAQDTFEVVREREMTMELSFDNKYSTGGSRPLYYSGDTVTVTYTVYKADQIVTGLNCEYRAYYGNNIVSVGTISSGTFSFTIPSDYEGVITVSVEGIDSQGEEVSTSENIDVRGTGIIVNANKNQYMPGDTVKIQYEVVGTEPSGAQYYYEITDNQNNVIKRESLTSGKGTFEFTIPDGDPPDTYYITVIMTDSSGVEITHESETISKLRGYMVTFTLDKNTYRPGETVTLHYKVISLDGSDFPEEFSITYGFFGLPTQTQEVTKTSGDLKLKVPEDQADGEGLISMGSSLPGSTTAVQQADIRESPNPLAETVGDMSLLEILLLIFVIIALIFGIGGWRKGKKAMDEAKLPPWKKEGSLPEPEKFKETEAEPMPEPLPETPPSEEPRMPPAPPKDM
jgi:hypothetical protein